MNKKEKSKLLANAFVKLVVIENGFVRTTYKLGPKGAKAVMNWGRFEVIDGFLTWTHRTTDKNRIVFEDKSLASLGLDKIDLANA